MNDILMNLLMFEIKIRDQYYNLIPTIYNILNKLAIFYHWIINHPLYQILIQKNRMLIVGMKSNNLNNCTITLTIVENNLVMIAA